MKAHQIEFGDMIQVHPGIRAERVTQHIFRKCWGKRLDPKYVAFCTPIPDNKLEWLLVEADAEVTRVGSTKDLGRNN